MYNHYCLRKIKIVVPFMVVLISLAFMLLGLSCGSKNRANPTHVMNIVNDTVSVSAGYHQAYPVTITSEMKNPMLVCSYKASGGTGNDIVVYIMDEANYINWKNGQQVSFYYNSGKSTTASFSVAMNALGTYYIVYDNAFSTVSSKNVVSRVDLKYNI